MNHPRCTMLGALLATFASSVGSAQELAPRAEGSATLSAPSEPSKFLGSPSGSPFGRLGPYDLSRPSGASLWPQLRASLGFRHLEAEGATSASQQLARFGVAMNVWKVALGLELDIILDDHEELVEQYYNQLNDLLSVVKYAEFGGPGDTIHARAGVLADATLGHGTILGHFYNNTLLEQPKTGLVAAIDLRILGLELLSDDVLEQQVSGARLTYKPLLDTGLPFVRQGTIGTSLVVDRSAPDKITLDSNGRPQVTDAGELRASDEQLSVYGVDIEVPIFQSSFLALVPYADQNFISSAGSGFHAGAYGRFSLPLHIPLSASVRVEWRRFTKGYIPTYFDAFYEFERLRYPSLDSATTKFQELRDFDARSGWLGEVQVELPGLFQVAALYERNESSQTSRADLYASFTGFDWLRVRAHYQKRGFNELEELTSFDEQSFVSIQALLQIYSFLFVDLRASRRWQVDADTGELRAIDVIEPSLALVFDW